MNNFDHLTKEELIKELQRLQKSVKNKTFGLVWKDLAEAFDIQSENKIPALEEVPSLSVLNMDDKPVNILIEGDNYHTLTCLNYTHKNKIDLIYIDPPYNTGSDGFRYKDKRVSDKFPDGVDVPKDHPFRHSYWLSFMRKRLELSKSLLKSSGIIALSIDDNEVSQLKLLCDSIFTQKNFIAQITVQTNPRGSQASTHVADVHEYILLYARDEAKVGALGKEKCEGDLKDYPLKDTNGHNYRLLGLRQRGGEWRREQRPKMFYPFYVNPNNGHVSLEKSVDFSVEVLPKRPTGEEGRWTWSSEKANGSISSLVGKEVSGRDDNNKFDIFRIDYFDKIGGNKTKTKTIWVDKLINYQNGRQELREILGKDEFEYPKPIRLIQEVIASCTDKNSLVLDFFAGSGTTGHAVLRQNSIDGGNRQFILATNNENNIMENVCYPRIKNVISGYEFNGIKKEVIYEKKLTLAFLRDADKHLKELSSIQEKEKKKWDSLKQKIIDQKIVLEAEKKIKDYAPGLGGSIKYYRTSFVGSNYILKATDRDTIELAKNAGELLALAENTLNKSLDNSYYVFYDNPHQCTAIYFREELDEYMNFIEKVNTQEKPTTVYVFSWGDAINAEDFQTNNKVTVKTMPKPIMEIYRSIYNLEIA